MKPQKPPLTDAMIELVARRFRILGEPQRLRILQVLEQGEHTVGAITERLGGTQPNISKHLQTFYDAGLVGRRRECNSVYYFIADPILFKLCDLVCRSAAEQVREQLQSLTVAVPVKAKRGER